MSIAMFLICKFNVRLCKKKEVDSTTMINDSDTDTLCYSDSDDEPYFYEDTGSKSDESDGHGQVSF